MQLLKLLAMKWSRNKQPLSRVKGLGESWGPFHFFSRGTDTSEDELFHPTR